jgi:putative ABC transport system substrate-binding protein
MCIIDRRWKPAILKDLKEKTMSRIKMKWLYIFIVLVPLINLLSVEARAEKRIGVLMFGEEVRYHENKNGILDQLKEGGFGEPKVKYIMENAEGSKAKAAELVRKFAAAKLDLIITIGTSATIAVTKEIKDVPIVFCMASNPLEAGIARAWKSSGNNTTGASPRVPMTKLVNSLKKLAPVKRLAVLYTPGEKQTEIQLKELQELQTSSHLKVIPVILTSQEEVAQILSVVIPTADALCLTGSSIVGAAVPMIVDMANKANVITITHLDDLVGKGVLLGVCANSYRVGRLAGKKAIQILKGAKPSSIPIEAEKTMDVLLNVKTAKAGRFQLPPKFMKTVTKTIE